MLFCADKDYYFSLFKGKMSVYHFMKRKEVFLDFYEDEENMDLLNVNRKDKIILMDMDSKWAMLRIETPKR